MRQEYLNSIKAGAIEGWYKYKITPSLTAAQAALESGWGTSKLAAPPYNNNFGIKAGAEWTGKTASMSTQEWNGSRFITIVDTFRAYDSINDSVEDHGVFFTSTEWRINNYRNVVGEGDYKKACYAVANAGYATDPNYATKLINIIETYNLQSWDVEAQNGNPNNEAIENTKTSKVVGGSISSAASQSVSSLLLSVIGDSLGVGTEKFLNKYSWAKVFHDNLGSRQWTHSTASLDATKVLQTMINNGNLQQNVVFILGTNRGVTAVEIDNVVSMCGRDRNIILVDTASEVNHRNTVSNIYSEASKRHQNVYYANWSDYARANIATWYHADGANGTRIHMKDAGYQKHAEFIIQAVYEAANTNWVEEVSTPTEKNTERINIYDVEYDDGKYTSPKGDSSIYNKELNDQLGFRPKKAQIMWIERKYTGEEDNAADLLEAALKKMDEYSVPAAQYTVPMRYFPSEVSIGDTGYFIDHEFNPPLYIFARVLSMTTSVTNPGSDSVVIGNVIEVHPKDKADILALQKELQENREEARLEYWKVPPIVLQIISSNGLNFKTKPGELYSDLVHSTIKEPEVKNGFVDIPVHNAKKVGARISITGSIKNNYIDIVDEITSEMNAPIPEEAFTGPVDPNSNPQGSVVKDITAPLDVRQLIVKQLDVQLLDSEGLNMQKTTLSVYEDSTFALKVNGLPKHINKIRILSNQNIVLDDISALDTSDPVSGVTDKTRLYVKAFQEDKEVTHKFKNFSWTRISSNKRLDEEWNDANKFNETNGIDLMPADVFGNESTFVCKMFDENGKFIAATSSSVTITQEGNKNTISDSTTPPSFPSPGDKWTAIDGELEEEYHYVDGEWTQTGVSKKVDEALEEAGQARQDAVDAYEKAVVDAKRAADEADALIRAEIEQEVGAVETELLKAKQEALDASNQALTDAKAHAIAQDVALKTILQGEIDGAEAEALAAKQAAQDAYTNALTDAKAHAEAEDSRIRGELETDIGGAIDLAEQAKQDAIDKADQALVDAKAHAVAQDVLLKQVIGLEIDGAIEIAEQAKQDAIDKSQTAYDDAVAEADRLAGLRDDGITITAGQITAGVIDAARLNASAIVTSGLTANVIKSTHIQSSTLLVDKIFATQVMVDHLWSKAIWTTKLTALKIDASQINAGTINTGRLNVEEIVANGLVANVISATHINGDTALFDKLFSTTLATDRLVARGAWITNANIVNLDASKINAGTIDTARLNASAIVTAGLTADVVTATHIKSENALIDNIFANQILVDHLWSKAIWTNKITTMSLNASQIKAGTIDAARLNASSIVTAGLTANVVKSTHIQADELLVDKVFANQASVDKLWAKAIWTAKLTALKIDASQINAGTINVGRLNVKEIVTNGLSTDVVTSTHIKASEALIDTIFGATAYINKLTSKTAFINNIKAISIDVDKITGNYATFLKTAWQSLNSSATVDGNRIRIDNASGDFIEMNNIPELRSSDEVGTSVVLGKGRVHFYDSAGNSKGYVGTDIHTIGNRDFGTFLSKGGGTYRFARMAPARTLAYNEYTVPAGRTDRVTIIEDMVRAGLLPDGNEAQFVQKSNMIAGFHGWPKLPGAWPTQVAGNKIRYSEKTVATTGEAYHTGWMYTLSNSVNDVWKFYVNDDVVFNGAYGASSDRRLKHDIESSQIDALSHIESLSFKEFSWNKNGKFEPLGVIAQDSGILRIPSNNPDEMESIDGFRSSLLALKGVQELQKIVMEQAEEIKQLKEKINK